MYWHTVDSKYLKCKELQKRTKLYVKGRDACSSPTYNLVFIYAPPIPSPTIHIALLEFVLNDLKGHFDLAVAWLYAEYSIAEGYLHSAQNNLQYDSCLTGLLRGAKAKLDTRDR